MKKNPYKKKPGDLELRILPDGRTVFVAPDQDMTELIDSLKQTPHLESSNNDTTSVRAEQNS